MLREIKKHTLNFFDEYEVYRMNQLATGQQVLCASDYFDEVYSIEHLEEPIKKEFKQRFGSFFNPSICNLI